MPRENFSSRIIERLQKSVGLRCSNPECRVPTSAASTDSENIALIGEAAHISAASAGGLRFQALMNVKERGSFANAIWLCSNCHKKVDRDELAYTVSVLQKWKKQAELQAQQEIGQKLPTDIDAQNLLRSAFSAVPVKFSRSAISNVHCAVQRHLESLDPRFSVKTTYDGVITHHFLSALQPASFTLTVKDHSKGDFLLQHENMIDHGDAAVISTENVTVSGSKLLDLILTGDPNSTGTVVLKPNTTEAVVKLHLLDPTTNLIEPFDDMPGEIVAGRKSLTFSGSNCGGILQMTFRKHLPAFEENDETEFGPCFHEWSGKDVRKLPYRDKLAHLFGRLQSHRVLQFAVEVGGQELVSGGLLDSEAGHKAATAVLNLIEYAKKVEALSVHLNTRINFSFEHVITRREVFDVGEAIDVFASRHTADKYDVKVNPVVTLTLGDDLASAEALHDGAAIEVVMREDVGQRISVFGQMIDLPLREVFISGASAKLLDDVTKVKPGDKVRIELQPSLNFKYSSRYLFPTDLGE